VREGAAATPSVLLVQRVPAAPLVVAGSVLLAVAEQVGRAGTLTPRLRYWLVWTPRILLLLSGAFLALLSLDVFVPGARVGEVAIGLLLHNVPALALLGLWLAAWRRPRVGALALAAFAAWWLPAFASRGFPPPIALLMAGLPLTVSALFLVGWVQFAGARAFPDARAASGAQPACAYSADRSRRPGCGLPERQCRRAGGPGRQRRGTVAPAQPLSAPTVRRPRLAPGRGEGRVSPASPRVWVSRPRRRPGPPARLHGAPPGSTAGLPAVNTRAHATGNGVSAVDRSSTSGYPWADPGGARSR
jgi:hypothetical protein